MFAVGDTGATRTLLTEEAARPYRLVELDPQEERVVVRLILSLPFLESISEVEISYSSL